MEVVETLMEQAKAGGSGNASSRPSKRMLVLRWLIACTVLGIMFLQAFFGWLSQLTSDEKIWKRAKELIEIYMQRNGSCEPVEIPQECAQIEGA